MTLEEIKFIAKYLYDLFGYACLRSGEFTIDDLGGDELKPLNITVRKAKYAENEETQILQGDNLFWIANNSNDASDFQKSYLIDQHIGTPDELLIHVVRYRAGLTALMSDGRTKISVIKSRQIDAGQATSSSSSSGAPRSHHKSSGKSPAKAAVPIASSSSSSSSSWYSPGSPSSSSASSSSVSGPSIAHRNIRSVKVSGHTGGGQSVHLNPKLPGQTTIETPIEFVIADFSGTPTSSGARNIFHAEQRLIYAMMYLNTSDIFGKNLNIGGTKRACQHCEPIVGLARKVLQNFSAELRFSTTGVQIHATNSINLDTSLLTGSMQFYQLEKAGAISNATGLGDISGIISGY